MLYYNNDRSVQQTVELLQQALKRQHVAYSNVLKHTAQTGGATGDMPPALADTPDTRVPIRNTRGPLDFGLPTSMLSTEDAAWYRSPAFPLSGNARFEPVSFIDGQRSVSKIRHGVSATFGPVSQDMVTRYLDDLVKIGVVVWK